MRVTDIPVGQDYRSFKVQMQAPPNPSVIACKLYVISDTFVGEEVSKDIKVCNSLWYVYLATDLPRPITDEGRRCINSQCGGTR